MATKAFILSFRGLKDLDGLGDLPGAPEAARFTLSGKTRLKARHSREDGGAAA